MRLTADDIWPFSTIDEEAKTVTIDYHQLANSYAESFSEEFTSRVFTEAMKAKTELMKELGFIEEREHPYVAHTREHMRDPIVRDVWVPRGRY